MAMVGGDERIVGAHDKAVPATLGWIEKGDERTVTGINRRWGNVRLEDAKGNAVL